MQKNKNPNFSLITIIKKDMLKIIFFLITCIHMIQCLKETDFCLRNKNTKIKCDGQHSFYCNNNLCSKDKISCQRLMALLEKNKIYQKIDDESFKMKYIKECSKLAEYKWNSNNVCLNNKNCVSTAMRLWSLDRIKQGECKCKGNYHFRCSSDYCASDKRACLDLNQNIKIKKC